MKDPFEFLPKQDPFRLIFTIDGRGAKWKARMLLELMSRMPQEELLQRLQQLAGLEVAQSR